METSRRFFNKILVVDLAIILLAAGFLLPCLKSGLLDCWDDYYVIKNNPFIRDFRNLPGLFTPDYFSAARTDGRTAAGEETYRPIVTLSYFLDFRLWPKALAAGAHVQSLLEHALVCWLIYILLQILNAPRGVSLFSTLIFTVHPVHSETINMVSYREDILCALFFLAAVIFHLKYGKTLRKKWLVLSCLFFALALLSKEMAVTFLPVVFLLGLPGKVRFVRQKGALILYGIITAVYLLIYLNFRRLTETATFCVGLAAERLWLILTLPGLYIRQLLTGYPLKLVHVYRPNWPDFAILAAFLGLFIYLLKNYTRFKLPAVMFASFLIALVPVLNIITIDPPVADRYLYLPAAFFVPGVISLLRLRIRGKTTYIGTGFLVLIVLFFGIRSSRRCRLWRDETVFAGQLIRESPESPRAWSTYGNVLLAEKNNPAEAEKAYLKALELTPGSTVVRLNLAGVYVRQDRLKEAASVFEEIAALEINVSDEASYNLGVVYTKMEKIPEAKEAFKRTLSLNPHFYRARYQYALLLIKDREYLRAKNELETVISDAPDYWNAYGMLGLMYVEMGRYEQSERYLEKFISHASSDNPIYAVCREKLEQMRRQNVQ